MARIAAGTLDNHPQHLREWIGGAQTIKPGAKMPSIRLNADDMDALVAYLETLK